jgi:methyl-accepting chemotaxis protein
MLSAPFKGKRLYLINRDFQLRYTRIAVIVGLCSTILTFTLILTPLFKLNILRFPNFVPYPFIFGMAVAAVANFLIVAFMGVVITHRIAGPMFSLVRHIRMIQLGTLKEPLRVRESDDLKYLVRNFNEMVEHLAATTRKDRSRIDGILEALSQESPKTEDLAKARALAEELKADLAARVDLAPDGGKQTETA